MIEKLGPRRGEMLEMKNPGQGLVRLLYRIPARGLFGYRSEFLTDTRGTGIMHHRFLDYGPWAGPLAGRTRGIAGVDGEWHDRRVRPGDICRSGRRCSWRRATPVYEGMIVGENCASGRHGRESDEGEEADEHAHRRARDENIQLEPPRELTLEARPGVYRGRRADRGDAAVDPAAEALAERVGSEEAVARGEARARVALYVVEVVVDAILAPSPLHCKENRAMSDMFESSESVAVSSRRPR